MVCAEKRLIYTPEKRIPIGEIIILPDGHRALRIKKAGGKAVEIVRIETLLEILYSAEYPTTEMFAKR